MKQFLFAMVILCAAAMPPAASAQSRVLTYSDQEIMLASADPRLAANKRLIYDFWREVIEGAHTELAEKYLAGAYIQHNPNVPNGLVGFIDFFSRRKPVTIEPRVKSPLVAIVAEGDLVVLSFVHRGGDPKRPESIYTTTWFDMFRVENGKIAEHWDPALKG
jgi:predicted SnoaL-like aldol condensation-catalyzing enzyme